MSLTAVLLTFLFSFFVQSEKVEQKIDLARSEIISRQYLQLRLQDIWMGIDSRSAPYTKLFPEEKKESLLLLFNNGIDPDPAFSGTVIGRFYLDEERRLNLAIWPLDKSNISWRNETLLTDVSDYKFEFLCRDPLQWKTQLPQKTPQMPLLVRLTVWRDENKPIQFAFTVPSTEIPTFRETSS